MPHAREFINLLLGFDIYVGLMCFFTECFFLSLRIFHLTENIFSHGMHGTHGNYSFGVFFLPQITQITLIDISFFDSLVLVCD